MKNVLFIFGVVVLVLFSSNISNHVTSFRAIPISNRRLATADFTGFIGNSKNKSKAAMITCRGGGLHAIPPTVSSTVLSKSGLVASWAVAVGGFLIRNYKTSNPWPAVLTTGPRRFWNFVHAISSTVFSGTILVTTLLEWLVVRSGTPAVIQFWFLTVPAVDVAVVLPALTGAIVSGVAQSIQEYGRVVEAPKYVKAVLHTMATFGLWWALTDRPTQHGARQAVVAWLESSANSSIGSGGGGRSPIPAILHWRKASNVVSCLFVMALYVLMVLKPGRPDLPPIR